MTAEQKELIETKFDGVHALIQSNFDVMNIELRYIKEQVTKTNGRVTKLEEESSNCPNLGKLKIRVYNLEKWQWKSVGIITGVGAVLGFIFKYVL